MAEACELFEPDGNGHLGPVGVSLEWFVYDMEWYILMYSRWTSDWRIILDYFLFWQLQQHRHFVI